MIDELERLKTLASSDRSLIIEVRNRLDAVYALTYTIVSHIAEIEDVVTDLLALIDEINELLDEKEKELNNV